MTEQKKTIISAAVFGTRLRPLKKDKAKALSPVADKAYDAEHLFEYAART